MKRLLLSIVLALIMLLAMPLTALAIAEPDTNPQVSAVYVYEDLLEDGDIGVLADIFTDYTISGNPPTGETATEAFLVVLIDIDGVTQLKAVAPYAFDDLGFGRNLAWIYFTPAEVTAFGIDRANEALYEVWIVGNPSLTWVPGPDPPKTITGIDYWQPAGTSTSFFFAQKVLTYAKILGLAWTEDLLDESTGRLTTLGEGYFMSVIPGLRDITLLVFAAGEEAPIVEDLDYSTEFGATIADNGGSVAGSPVTLVEGANTVDVTGLGTLTVELERGTIGTAVTDVCTVTDSPAPLIYGLNTINTEGIVGDITVNVSLDTPGAAGVAAVEGSGFDLTDPAAEFGLGRGMFGGMIFAALAIYAVSRKSHMKGGMLYFIFSVFLLVGKELFIVPDLVLYMMLLGNVVFAGFFLFYKGATV